MTEEQADDQPNTGAGNAGTGPTTGTTGRSEDSTSGVSTQEAAERINPGRTDDGAGFTDPTDSGSQQ